MTYSDTDIARLPLTEGKDELLAELLATPHDVPDHPPTHLRHRRVLRVALAGVAAAAVAAVGVTVVVQRPAGAPGAAPSAGPSESTSSGPGSSATAIGEFPTRLVAMAERMPRILLDDPGWTVDTVYGFGKKDGTLGFRHGDQYLELNWYPASAYDGYFHDREDDPSIAHAATQLFGGEARLFTYSSSDHATMLRPDGRSFVELRGGGLTEKQYLELTSHLRQVSVREFLEAMPASVVVPGKEDTAAQQVLADIPVPPGFAFKPNGDVDDSYQFGAAVTGQVFCAWAEVYRTGGAAAKKQAVTALESSHHWKVLADMNARGDWPEAIWEYADRVAAGDPPTREELDGGLSCSS
jgi:hypothetical protein